MNYSNYQLAIFAFAADDTAGNAVVEAVAGSGKTTTLVQMLKGRPGATIFLAFNKSIATELESRGVNARTFHSLCFGPVTKHKGTRNVETNKLRKIIDAQFSGEQVRMYGTFCAKLVGLARQAGIGCLVPDVLDQWYEIVEHHDLDLDAPAVMGDGIELARNLLGWSNASPMIDFDDLLYLAVKEGLALPKYDFVCVDEAQDTNAIQRAILRKIMHQRSRLVAVGDPAQAIYGFRGADSESLNLIASEFNCRRLPLSVSYRCPQTVIGYARQWVAHIEAAPNAPAGEVKRLDKWDEKVFAAGDLVVCRTTAPLLTLGYKLLKSRKPVRIMGREIGDGLVALIKKMNARGIDNLIAKLSDWASRESEKALAKKDEGKAEAIRDKADAILCLVDSMPETERTVPALIDTIYDLFADKAAATVLATIHKAKGLEADKVFWLNHSKCPSMWARQPWQVQQEVNLCYVATTRAKQTLVLIDEPTAK